MLWLILLLSKVKDLFSRGENDVEQVDEYLKVLLQIGFLNEKKPPIVSFEVRPFGDEDPMY